MKRIISAYERVAVWHTATEAAPTQPPAGMQKLYHLTDKANFKLKPQYHPENNTTFGGEWPEAGVFLGKDPEAWVNGHGYWRPYVAEFHVPEDIDKREGVMSGGYSGERFIPARHFKDVHLNRVIPLDAYAREQYGSLGWSEDPMSYGGEPTDFDTNKPHPEGYGAWDGPLSPFQGYTYQGDVRDRPPEWQKYYEKRIRRMRKEKERMNGA